MLKLLSNILSLIAPMPLQIKCPPFQKCLNPPVVRVVVRIDCVKVGEDTHLKPQCSASHLQQEEECGGEL